MLLIVLAGCDDPSVAEYVYAGTQLAVEACIKRNTSSLVDASVIKENCIKKHQKNINPQMLTATLTPDVENPYGLSLSAVVANKSTDQIITGIDITVPVTREGSPDLVLTGVVHDLWIYPGGSGQGYARYTSVDSDAVWTKAKELMKAGAKWTWNISKATAVGFKLKP
jgi:hypothetical protein